MNQSLYSIIVRKKIAYYETERDFLDTIVLKSTFSTQQQQQKVMAIAN